MCQYVLLAERKCQLPSMQKQSHLRTIREGSGGLKGARAREDWNTCFPPSIHDQVPGKINLFTYFSTKTWFRVNSVSVSGVVKARSPHTNRPTPTPRRISIRQLRKGRHKPLKVYNLLRDV